MTKIEDIKDDIDMVAASAILIDYQIENYKDEDVEFDVYCEHFHYFKKNDNYLFCINYRTNKDNIESFSISNKVGKRKKYNKDFVSFNSPTKQQITECLPELLKKLAKVK